jgi:hypothetical protein
MQPRVRIEFECALDHPSSHLASAGEASCAVASGGRESLAMIKLRELWRCLGRRVRNAAPCKHAQHGDREKQGLRGRRQVILISRPPIAINRKRRSYQGNDFSFCEMTYGSEHRLAGNSDHAFEGQIHLQDQENGPSDRER